MGKEKLYTRKIWLNLTEELYQKLKDQAKKEGRSMSDILRESLRKYLSQSP